MVCDSSNKETWAVPDYDDDEPPDSPPELRLQLLPREDILRRLQDRQLYLRYRIEVNIRSLKNSRTNVESWGFFSGLQALQLRKCLIQRAIIDEKMFRRLPLMPGMSITACDRAAAMKRHEQVIVEHHIKTMESSPHAISLDYHRLFLSFARTNLNLPRGNTNRTNQRFDPAYLRFFNTLKSPSVYDAEQDMIWCPFEDDWFEAVHVSAVQIYPASGAKMMAGIFSTNNELWSSKNGIFMTYDIARSFSEGRLYLIPDIEPGLGESIEDWVEQDGEDRPWLIRNINTEGYDETHDDARWILDNLESLEGKRVFFPSGSEPRARYLYWHYLRCRLGSKLRHEDTTRFHWKCAGDSMGKGMLHDLFERWGEDFEGITDLASPNSGIETGAPKHLLSLCLVSANYWSIAWRMDTAPCYDVDEEMQRRGQVWIGADDLIEIEDDSDLLPV